MVDFYIDTIFVTIWRLTMVGHDWFSYRDSVCDNATLDHDWFRPYFNYFVSIVNHDFIMVTIEMVAMPICAHPL